MAKTTQRQAGSTPIVQFDDTVAGHRPEVMAGGFTKTVNGSVTRPTGTDIYAAGDVISPTVAAVITFADCARANGGSGILLSALLIDSANQTVKGSFELWLFDTTVGPDADNAAFTPTDAELATLVAVIPFTAPYVGDATAAAGGNCVYSGDVSNRPFTCGAASKSLFGVLVVRNAYTPVSEGIFTVRLRIAQD